MSREYYPEHLKRLVDDGTCVWVRAGRASDKKELATLLDETELVGENAGRLVCGASGCAVTMELVEKGDEVSLTIEGIIDMSYVCTVTSGLNKCPPGMVTPNLSDK